MDRNCEPSKEPLPEAGTDSMQVAQQQLETFIADEIRYHIIPDRHRKQVAIDGPTDMKVKDLVIPPTVCHSGSDYAVTTISPLAFARLSHLRNIQLPDSIEEIGRHAFFGCGRLRRLFIPASTVSIGVRALAGCEQLTGITLPASIASIGECAFFQCRRLTSITCLAVVPPPISFSEMIEVNRVMCTVHVPMQAVDSYRAAEVWNEFAIMGDADDSVYL